MNFKQGIVFENGEVTGGFGINVADKRGRTTEICGWIQQWGYNYVRDADGNMTQGPFYIYYGEIPMYCTLAPQISMGYQLPPDSYYGSGAGGGYNPSPQLTEAEYFESTFYVKPGEKPINPIDFLKCFTNNSNNIYKVSVSVDQPIAGSTAVLNPLASHRVGHTYLTLTQIKSNGETIQRTIGFYPSYGGHPLNPYVPSKFGDDSDYSGGWDVQLTFQVTGAELMQIVNFIPGYTNANYDLSNRNCGNFALDALGQIGINVAPFWMNTYWYSSINPNYGGYSPPSEIRGPSMGALGEQIYNTPPNRTTAKSHAGGNAPKNLGKCD